MILRPASLASRLLLAQVLVISVGTITLIGAISLIGPSLFRNHLERTGEESPEVLLHAEEAFASSFAISLAVATIAALIAAGLVSWFLVKRVAHPAEELAVAADAIAAGHYGFDIPTAGFGSEMSRLSGAFRHMAGRLAESDVTRTRLLSDLAHELRTPLATLEAYIDGLEDGVVRPDTKSWAIMRDQVNRLHRLANDVREVAAAEEHALGLVLEPTDPASITWAAVAAAEPQYQAKGVGIDVTSVASEVEVAADYERLQQVLANLLDNSLRHTPPGGSVNVHITNDRDTVTITVRDTGDGIPPDQLEAVFQRFHRADLSRAAASGGGSGLGLTIARAIVKDHGGTLTASSRGPGSGSTLTLAIPRITKG
jgi:two-component system sensor histidine kinase BaeS